RGRRAESGREPLPRRGGSGTGQSEQGRSATTGGCREAFDGRRTKPVKEWPNLIGSAWQDVVEVRLDRGHEIGNPTRKTGWGSLKVHPAGLIRDRRCDQRAPRDICSARAPETPMTSPTSRHERPSCFNSSTAPCRTRRKSSFSRASIRSISRYCSTRSVMQVSALM